MTVRLRADIGMLVVGCSMLAGLSLFAQQPTILPPGAASQLMIPQAKVEISPEENVSVTAEFDPPIVAAGQKAVYRVNVTATQNSILWPDVIAAPPELKFSDAARGQLTQPDGARFQPLTAFAYEVATTASGQFTVPAFTVVVGEKKVEVPAASLEVLAANSVVPANARRLLLELSQTNLYFGQPFSVRVIAPAGAGNSLAGLRDVQFNGGGIFADKLSIRSSASAVKIGGQLVQAFIYEATVMPLTVGRCEVSAQAFTVPLFSAGQITITAGGGPVVIGGGAQVKAALLTSESTSLLVRPLPAEKELPGFTGAMGKFSLEGVSLATNRLHVGEPVRLKYNFISGTNLVRFVPPSTPRSRQWQIIPGQPGENVFTFIPLTDEVANTPAIPFAAFDFVAGKFYDLTIPAQPVTVMNDGLPTQLAGWDAEKSAPLKLSGLATAPGKSVSSLKPLQAQPWFIGLQLVPVILLLLLWQWDQRRRFLEAHPEVVWRRWAKKELKRERSLMRIAVECKDVRCFVNSAADAMQVVAAAHYRTNKRTMVGLDVLNLLRPQDRNGLSGDAVRTIFAAVDVRYKNRGKADAGISPSEELLALAPEVEALLVKLEETL